MYRKMAYIVMLSACVAVTASAGGKKNRSGPVVVPPSAHAYGRTMGEWGAAWWQWAFAQPAGENPIDIPDGGTQTTAQRGKVWFLAGTWGNDDGQIVREVTVPPGKAIFFPVLNSVWVAVTRGIDEPDDPFSVPGAEAFARWFIEMDREPDLEVRINGTSLGSTDYVIPYEPDFGVTMKVPDDLTAYRAISPVFSVRMPEDNIWGIDAGSYPDAVADGYWFMLDRLPRGTPTTIEFKGRDNRNGWTVDVKYIVRVGSP